MHIELHNNKERADWLLPYVCIVSSRFPLDILVFHGGANKKRFFILPSRS
jgi:hypothetical protein